MNKSEPKISAKLSNLLSAWTEADAAASKYKALENSLRKEIFDLCFPEPEKGANNHCHLPFDRTLVGDYKTNLSADKSLALAILTNKKSNVRPIVEKVVNWKPEVSKSEYNKLSNEEKALLGDLITEKPGMPSLELRVTSKMRKKF